MKTMVDVKANTQYLDISRKTSNVNAWESAMYIRLWYEQRGYLAGKPKFATKPVKKPEGHHRKGCTDLLRQVQLKSLGA